MSGGGCKIGVVIVRDLVEVGGNEAAAAAASTTIGLAEILVRLR